MHKYLCDPYILHTYITVLVAYFIGIVVRGVAHDTVLGIFRVLNIHTYGAAPFIAVHFQSMTFLGQRSSVAPHLTARF